MLSNAFHVLRDDPQRVGSTLYPPDLLPEVRARAVAPVDVDRALVGEFVDLAHDADDTKRALAARAGGAGPGPRPHLPARGRRAARGLRPALLRHLLLWASTWWATRFTRFAEPDRFGDVTPEDARRYGQVRDRYAALLGSWVGEAAHGLRPGRGAAGRLGLRHAAAAAVAARSWRRCAATRSLSGTHLGAPDGFILAVGDGIKPGVVLRDASVLDLAPTILYLMGLPVARDMEGRVLTEMLEESFARAHPVTFIPSYESLAVAPGSGRGPGPAAACPDEDL